MNILIIGAGDIGFQLSKRLSEQQHNITMIELDPQKVIRASEQLDAFVIQGNGASLKVLEKANIAQIDILAAMSDNDEANLMACRLAKKVGVPTTIARVRNPEFTEPDFILSPQELGTDLIIHPEKEVAEAVVRLIKRSCATYAVDFEKGRIQVLGLRLTRNAPLLHHSLIKLNQRYDDPPLRVVAINRNYNTLIPKGHDVLMPDDQVFVVCDSSYSSTFIALAGHKETPLKDVMILGGGMVGKFIANSLKDQANIKIIEEDEAKASQVAQELPETLVIHGDGTDFDLLSNEGLLEMDAFVAVTGNDQNNIITTLLAQHSNVSRSIALVNQVEYLSIMPKIGLDAVVSKQLLTVNAVQRFIQHQQIASIASLPGINAQAIEYIAREGSEITLHPLKDIHFPPDAIVGAILHEDNYIIPHGDTQIEQGDKTVIFALPHAINQLDQLFGKKQESRRNRLYKFLRLSN